MEPMIELEIQAKQLLPSKDLEHIVRPQASSYVIRKNIVDIKISKPDLHLDDEITLKSSKSKPDQMISIRSSSRLNLSPYKPHTITIDSKKLFDYGGMTDLCRPERDMTLKIPLMTATKILRTYKLGTSPEAKVSLLRSKLIEKMDQLRQTSKYHDNHLYNQSIVNNLLSKSRVYQTSVINNKIRNHLHRTMKNSNSVGDDLDDDIDDETVHSDTSMSKSNIQALTKFKKSIVINPDLSSVNMHLYKRSTVDLSAGSTASTIDKQHQQQLQQQQDNVHDTTFVASIPIPTTPLYTPGTFRLPVEEVVPGFGNIPPHIENRLTAYRTHDNMAIQNEAALSDIILRESTFHQLDMAGTVAGDTYEDSRKEVFLKDNSCDHGLEDLNNDSQLLSDDNFNITEENSNVIDEQKPTRTLSSVKHNHHLAVSTANKGRLHCMKCYRSASLWCMTCSKAYCGLCWGKIIHHDLNKMMYYIEVSKEIDKINENKINNNNNKMKLSRGNSYSKSIMFQSNPFGTSDTKHRIKPSTSIGNHAHAMIPLPSKIITKYTDYSQPPVALTGTGAINLHEVDTRPCTAPITTISDLQRLHSANNNIKKFDSDKQKEMIMIDYNETKQNTMTMRNSLNSNNSSNGDMKKKTSDLQSHFPYSNKGDVIVRSPLKLHPLITITTAATFAVGSTPGAIDFAYSSKPSTGSRPLSGITYDIKPPEEWDFARSKELPEREISHFHNKAIVTTSAATNNTTTSTGSKKSNKK